MTRTITLTEILDHALPVIRFADKEFGTTSLDELLEFSNSELDEISGRLLRSILIIEYMKNKRLPISATIDTNASAGQIITING
jgi:hypothetical protein